MKRVKILRDFFAITLFAAVIGFFAAGYGSNSSVSALSGNSVNVYGAITVTVVNDISSVNDCYKRENRKFAAMSTVEVTGNRLWAAWMSGGDIEPHNDNCVIVAYSDDNGDTWVDPFIIIDDLSAGRTRDPVLWYAPTDELYLFFGASGTRLIKLTNVEGNISDVALSQVVTPFSETILNKPIVTSSGEWMCSTDPYDVSSSYSLENIYVSTDRGASWTKRGTITSSAERKLYHEGTIVEKNDGTLWVLSRIEGGSGNGIEQSFSTDGGYTWSVFQSNLSKPLIGPGSKCAITRLSDGGLLFVSNNSTSSRVDMTAYYSNNDGITWSSLLLDGRNNGCAYPDIAQASNGMIYVVWDYGRSLQCEIRLARFTVNDVVSGGFNSENASRPCVTKNDEYIDIIGINTPFERVVEVVKGSGTTKEEIIESLPTAISVNLDNGTSQVLSGSWSVNWFSSDYVGTYIFTFNADNMSDFYQDVNDSLTVKAIVAAKQSSGVGSGKGCASAADKFGFSTLAFAVLALACFALKQSRAARGKQ